MRKTLKHILPLLLALLLAAGSLFGCGVIDEETAVQLAEQVLVAALQNAQNQQGEPTAAPQHTAAPKQETAADNGSEASASVPDTVTYGEWYDTPYEVAEYLHLYGELPPNYLSKNEAKELGWDNSRGNLWDVAPGMSIGGDYFGNYEGSLPEKKGRRYTECDVNYDGGYRGAERIVFSNDGLIYYTDDHYESFTLLYGEE